jgi:hypothetical protein
VNSVFSDYFVKKKPGKLKLFSVEPPSDPVQSPAEKAGLIRILI